MSNEKDDKLFFQGNVDFIEEEDKETKKDNELNINLKEENSEESEEEDQKDEEENIEMKTFTIELLIHSKVMDNREEINHCICHNYILPNGEEDLPKDDNKIKENENLFVEKEIIPGIEIPITRIKKNSKEKNELNFIESADKFYIKMNELTKELKKIGYPMSGSMINVYINYTKNYVYFGTEPLDNKVILFSYMLEPNKDVIKLKIINYIQKRMLDGYTNAIINTYFRKPIPKKRKSENNPSLDLKMYMPSMTNIDYFDKGNKKQKDENSLSSLDSINLEEKEEEEEEEEENNIDYKNLTDAKKRERKIGYIIEKVYAWRKLYNGYLDDNNKFIKYPLEKAALAIDVSKKSLDDYLLQIRFGRKCGFNFDENKNEKIGTLRTYNDEWKKNNIVNTEKKERKQRKKKTKKDKAKEENKEQNKISNISLELNKSGTKNLSNKSSLGLKRNKSKSKSLKKNK